MDPSLMDERELAARGRVFVDPCNKCRHNRQAHVFIPRVATEYVGEMEPITACLVCECKEFIDG